LNDDIVVALQRSGTAAPSTTRIGGRLAIRVCLTNHRTTAADLDLLVREVERLGRERVGSAARARVPA
jgi:aromatic-L-amino-acid/L-tryptophan decarboxylase